MGPVKVAEVKGSGFTPRNGSNADILIDVSLPSALEEGDKVLDCCFPCSLAKESSARSVELRELKIRYWLLHQGSVQSWIDTETVSPNGSAITRVKGPPGFPLVWY